MSILGVQIESKIRCCEGCGAELLKNECCRCVSCIDVEYDDVEGCFYCGHVRLSK